MWTYKVSLIIIKYYRHKADSRTIQKETWKTAPIKIPLYFLKRFPKYFGSTRSPDRTGFIKNNFKNRLFCLNLLVNRPNRNTCRQTYNVHSNFSLWVSLLTSESMIDTRQQSIINVALCGFGLIVCIHY